MCCQQSRRDRGIRGILTLLGLSLLGQMNIAIRNLRGYLVMLSQTYVKTMNMLCGSLSTCFLFVSLSRGSTADEIKYQLIQEPTVPVVIFRNRLVKMVHNRIMKDKSLAYQILYSAVKIIQQKTGATRFD